MENASKALIIAGAVLIAILLIGVGVLIYQGSLGSVTQGQDLMADNEKQMFNSGFDAYLGNNVRGTAARQLIAKVQSSNASTSSQVDLLKAHPSGSGDYTPSNPGKIELEANDINTSKTYTIRAKHTKGLIVAISIVEN